MVINDNKYDSLLAFIESGAKGDLSTDMVEYLQLLELVRTMHMRYENRQTIIKFLQQQPYGLSEYKANRYYSDAINFFYIDVHVTKQAFRNMYAEKLDRAADLVFQTATSSKDIDIYKNLVYAAMQARQLNESDPEDIPEEFFRKPIKVYTLDPTKIGRKPANRNRLAAHIDSLDIPETDKQRVKADAMIEDIEIFPDEDQ